MLGRRGSIAIACLCLLAPAAPVDAAVRVLRAVRISGASPFPAGCAARAGTEESQVQLGSEVEPSLAVDPLDPRLVVAAYQQDRIKTGASLGDVVSVSRDGGRHWRQAELTGTTTCEGSGGRTLGTDPWAAFGPRGTAYVASQLTDGYVVSRSTDGGHSWQTARASTSPGLDFDDKDSLLADPARPGRLYLVWDDLFGPNPINGAISTLRVDTSADGGVRWASRGTLYQPLAPVYGEAGPISIPGPHGSVVVLFEVTRQDSGIGLPPQPGEIVASRSRDGGRHWSSPAGVAIVPPGASTVRDPTNGACIRTGGDCPHNHLNDGLAAALEPGGAIDAVWQQEGPGGGAVMLARSTDGGARWSRPRAVVRTATEVFLPEIAAMPDGTAGISYEALRPARAGDQQLLADVYLATRGPEDTAFGRPVRLAGPFDLHTAPESTTESVGRFLGDYDGIVAFRDGFGVDFAASAPMAVDGLSDVFFSRAVLQRSRR